LLISPDHYVNRLLHADGVPLESLGAGGTPLSPEQSRAAWRALRTHWDAFRGTPSRSGWRAPLLRRAATCTPVRVMPAARGRGDPGRARPFGPSTCCRGRAWTVASGEKAYWGASRGLLIDDFYRHVRAGEHFWIDAPATLESLRVIQAVNDQCPGLSR
jgi:hypothetical protein